MFIKHQDLIAFTGTPTSTQQRRILAEAGFIHVTGLRCYHHSSDYEYYIGENVKSEELGCWEQNNGMNVIVTRGGEVWIMAGPCPDEQSSVIVETAPNGRGAFVPLSNGEQISHYELLRRVRDPNYNIFVQATS